MENSVLFGLQMFPMRVGTTKTGAGELVPACSDDLYLSLFQVSIICRFLSFVGCYQWFMPAIILM
jgi:hypothetical protein